MKDAFYFPHFIGSRHDRKIKRLRKELGIEGYGIFFMLLEVLREQADFTYPLSDTDLLSEEFGTSEQKINAVIHNYDLFAITNQNTHFLSPKLIIYIEPWLKRKEQARIAGIASGESRRLKIIEQELNGSSTDVEREPNNKRKKEINKEIINEKKQKPQFSIPTLDQVKDYCLERNNNVDPERWFDFYKSKGWMVGKNKMQDWKACVRTWEKQDVSSEKKAEIVFKPGNKDCRECWGIGYTIAPGSGKRSKCRCVKV